MDRKNLSKKKTKIVATIGPASESEEILKKIIGEGMNVARLNFSHNDHTWHGKTIDLIRGISNELDLPVGIMADLQGPRIRTRVSGDMEVKKGETIKISDVAIFPDFQKLIDQDPSVKIMLLDCPNIIQDINVGNEILIEDGTKTLRIVKKEKDFLEAESLSDGIIKNHKGVNIPDAPLTLDPITEKDEKDLAFVLSKEVNFVAMSFVKSGADIENLRNKIKKILGREDNLPQIVAKIERKEAIKNIDEIIAATDAVMVARGDLGIEIKETKVAILQKEIIAKSLQSIKPVIVATEMLGSMTNSPRPTRAEVSDVTNAVIDHADAVMLSGESASGKYPVEAVRTMVEIIENTEESPYDDISNLKIKQDFSNEYVGFIKNACSILQGSDIKTVVILSRGGFTARVISHFRPKQMILAGTNNEKTYQQLSLVWGIKPFLMENGKIDEVTEYLLEKAREKEVLKAGDKVVLIGKDESRKHRFVNIKEIN
jgi:pyruvate kinase